MFKWKDAFSVNISSIDEQHKELFSIGNSLYDVVSMRDDIDTYDDLVAALQRMQDYAIYHFGFEEKLMKDNGYPDFNNHKKQHDYFIQKIGSVDYEEMDKDQKQNGLDLIIFIANWIENHILKTDMKYKDFLNNK